MTTKISNCIYCNDKLLKFKRKYCSKFCKNQITNEQFQSYTNQRDKAIKRKLYLIKLFGAKCTMCGYNKNLSALHFHHINPKLKSFTVSQREIANRSLKILSEEVSKCTLLCSNCHMEYHHPNHTIVAEDGIAPSELSL